MPSGKTLAQVASKPSFRRFHPPVPDHPYRSGSTDRLLRRQRRLRQLRHHRHGLEPQPVRQQRLAIASRGQRNPTGAGRHPNDGATGGIALLRAADFNVVHLVSLVARVIQAVP